MRTGQVDICNVRIIFWCIIASAIECGKKKDCHNKVNIWLQKIKIKKQTEKDKNEEVAFYLYLTYLHAHFVIIMPLKWCFFLCVFSSTKYYKCNHLK